MTRVQVLLDARGTDAAQLSVSIRTLLPQVPSVEVVHADASLLAVLGHRFGSRVTAAVRLRTDAHVLVVPGSVALARGAVRRIIGDLAVPGRCLTCVLVPGADVGPRTACWSARWVAGYGGTVEELVDADLRFDRAHLPAGSPTARSWLRADRVGVAPVTDIGTPPGRWAWRVGATLWRDAAVARVRRPLGAARRRMARRRQRRLQPAQHAQTDR